MLAKPVTGGARYFRSMLTAAMMVLGVLLFGASAFAACEPGWVATAGGACMPKGSADCGPGRGYCDPGNVCRATGGCMPVGAVDCGQGRGYCDAGQSCMSGKGCMPVGSVDCGDGGYCAPGSVCVPGGHCRKL